MAAAAAVSGERADVVGRCRRFVASPGKAAGATTLVVIGYGNDSS